MQDEDKISVQKSFLEHIGKVIKWRRNHLGMSQEALGQFLGVKQATIARYEKGQGSIPASALPLISGVLCFGMNEFIPPDQPERISKEFRAIVMQGHMEKIIARRKQITESTSGIPKSSFGFMTLFSFPEEPRPFSDKEFDEFMGDDARQTDRELLIHTAALVDILSRENASASEKEIARILADYTISRILNDSGNAEARILDYCSTIRGQDSNETKP